MCLLRGRAGCLIEVNFRCKDDMCVCACGVCVRVVCVCGGCRGVCGCVRARARVCGVWVGGVCVCMCVCVGCVVCA